MGEFARNPGVMSPVEIVQIAHVCFMCPAGLSTTKSPACVCVDFSLIAALSPTYVDGLCNARPAKGITINIMFSLGMINNILNTFCGDHIL